MYPGPKVHRIGRRRLSRGQYPLAAGVTVAATANTNTATLTFNRPVIIGGPVPFTVTGRTVLSQTITSPSTINILFNGTLSTRSYALPSNPHNVRSYVGGPVAGTNGTFPLVAGVYTILLTAEIIGAGQYRLFFDQNITPSPDPTPVPEFLMYSPGANTWTPPTSVEQLLFPTNELAVTHAEVDCTLIAIMAQPPTILTTLPFQTAVPQTLFVP